MKNVHIKKGGVKHCDRGEKTFDLKNIDSQLSSDQKIIGKALKLANISSITSCDFFLPKKVASPESSGVIL